MRIRIGGHARQRASTYNIALRIIEETVEEPDSIVPGYAGRKIYQKRLDDYVLRVIVEQRKDIKTVISVYRARRKRYEL